MLRNWKAFSSLMSACLLCGCASVSNDFEAQLDKICDVKGAGDDPGWKIARGRIVLAAIAGHSYRTIDLFSGRSATKPDAQQALDRIDGAWDALDSADLQVKNHIFPVYRADYIVELARAAAVAEQPAVRTAKVLATGGGGLNFLTQSRPLLTSVVEDQLYVSAYKSMCASLANGDVVEAVTEAQARTTMRCISLQQFAASAAGTGKCSGAKAP